MAMTNKKLILYTTSNCPRCMVIKRWFKEKNISYEERNLENPEVMAELIMRDIFAFSTPILEVDGEFYFDKDLFIRDSLNESLLNKLIKKR
mgnify:CR=1 FL=1